MIDPNGAVDADPSGVELPETVETPAPEPGAEAADEGQGEAFWRDKYLKEGLPAQEERNRLKAQLAEVQSRQPQPPAADYAGDDGVDWGQIESIAPRDPVAHAMLVEKRNREALQRDIVIHHQLQTIPEAERKETLEHLLKNPSRFGDVFAARAELREAKLDQENARLRAQLAQHERKPDPDVLNPNAAPTLGRAVPARETKGFLTEEQFDAQAAQIRQGQGELAAMRFSEQNAGRIKG